MFFVLRRLNDNERQVEWQRNYHRMTTRGQHLRSHAKLHEKHIIAADCQRYHSTLFSPNQSFVKALFIPFLVQICHDFAWMNSLASWHFAIEGFLPNREIEMIKHDT